MAERNVTFKGKSMSLDGKEIKVGDKAPEFEATDTSLNPVKSSSFLGKTCIISSVVSLDTPVCDQQTHRFNESVAKLGKDVVVLTVSMDLPFAQKRWCGASSMTQAQVLSDYKNADFGRKFGVLLKDWHLLSRAVFVVDKKGIVQHVHYLKEISEHPDYDLILDEVSKLK